MYIYIYIYISWICTWSIYLHAHTCIYLRLERFSFCHAFIGSTWSIYIHTYTYIPLPSQDIRLLISGVWTSQLYYWPETPPVCRPLCFAYTQHRAMYGPPPTPLFSAWHHLILVMVISCKGLYTSISIVSAYCLAPISSAWSIYIHTYMYEPDLVRVNPRVKPRG